MRHSKPKLSASNYSTATVGDDIMTSETSCAVESTSSAVSSSTGAAPKRRPSVTSFASNTFGIGHHLPSVDGLASDDDIVRALDDAGFRKLYMWMDSDRF